MGTNKKRRHKKWMNNQKRKFLSEECNKIYYETLELAVFHKPQHESTMGKSLRIYMCNICNNYHFSSKEKRTYGSSTT